MRASLVLLAAAMLTAIAAAAEDRPLVSRGSHPRLFYTADRVAELKVRLGSEPEAAQAWSVVLTNAEQAASSGRVGAENVEELGLAYRVTGEQRFAVPLRKWLLQQVRRKTWSDPTLMKRDPPWHAGLEVARQCFAVSVGFDCVHDFLTEAERKEIASGLVTLGIVPTLDDWLLPGRRIHSLDTMGHNWWSACVFGAGLASLAVLDEEPRAADWLRRIASASTEWFDYSGNVLANKPRTFDHEGGFYESVNYAAFAMSEYLFFRLAWNNALSAPALPDVEILDRIGDFFLNTVYPNAGELMSLNFGDGSLHADGSRPVALLWANGFRKPRYLWYLKLTQNTSFREGLGRVSPFGLVYLPAEAEMNKAPATPDLPTTAIYPDMSWAVMRSSWEKNATLLAVKSGTTWNHAHADNGSFLLFHNGEYLLIDSGNCSYGRPEYDGYYRQGAAHNVVLFDGEGEHPGNTYYGSKFRGTLGWSVVSGDHLKYVMADATGPNARRFLRDYRHFLWIGDVILIMDDLQTYDFGQLEWLIHPGGAAKREGLDLRVTNRSAAVRVRPLFPETLPDAGLPTDYPEKMSLVEKEGLTDHDPDTTTNYFAFVPAEPERRTKFMTAVLLETGTNRAEPPKLERLRGNDWIGVRLEQKGHVAQVYLNLLADGRIAHRNSNAVIDGWETDALILAIEQGAEPRFFIADGSYLRRDGKTFHESLTKCTLDGPLEEEKSSQ